MKERRRKLVGRWQSHAEPRYCAVCKRRIPMTVARIAEYERKQTCSLKCKRKRASLRMMGHTASDYLPSPQEILAECERIKAENLEAMRNGTSRRHGCGHRRKHQRQTV